MTKNLVIIIATLLFSQSVRSQSKVEANIFNLRNDKGVCRACLFNNASSFDGENGKPFQCLAVPVKNRVAQAIFNNIPEGTYALFVFHDENNNNKMDKNFMGIPKEGYGASKNKLPFASAPDFNDNRFTVNSKTTVQLLVKIRNL
jgi:uncharacterized protein (DUF2141 family)